MTHRRSIHVTYTFLLILFSVLFSYDSAQAQDYLDMIKYNSHTFSEIQAEAERYFDGRDKGRGSGYKQWKRWEYRAERSLKEDGTVRSEAEKLAALESYNKKINLEALEQKRVDCMGEWQSEGPTVLEVTSGYNPGLGRVTSIGIHPEDSSTYIIGAHTGGVWKTTNDGNDWFSLSEEFVNLRVWSLEIAPSDGERYYWGSSNGILFKSVNAGESWEQLETPSTTGIHYIAVDPKNADRLLFADQFFGLYISEDAGASWENTGFIDAYDIEFHPTIDSIIYAAGQGVWRSMDYGKSFQRISDPAPGQITMISTTPAAPDHVYAVSAQGGAFGGFHVSKDLGVTFNTLDQGGLNYFGYSDTGSDGRGQAPRDMDIVVSPTDSNLVFISGINMWKSTDGGQNFNIYSHWIYQGDFGEHAYSHADIDITKIKHNRMYMGTDGGIYIMDSITAPKTATSIRDVSEGLAIHQIYRLGLSQSEDVHVTVGAQDNGSSIQVNGTWRNYFGADGMDCVVMDDEFNTVFGMYQNGGLLRSSDLGNSTDFLPADGLQGLIGEGNWVTPVTKSGISTLLVGYDAIYESTDLGDSFIPISQSFGGTRSVNDIEVSQANTDIIYAIIENSDLYKTEDAGRTDWTRMRIRSVSFLNGVAAHPMDTNLVAVATGDDSGRVLISEDGGLNWDEYDGLPELTAQSLVWQKDSTNTLYAGLDYGIYKLSLNSPESEFPSWTPFNNNLPNAYISDLEINHVTKRLYAASYGRGMWSTPICQPIISSNERVSELFELSIYPNPVNQASKLTLQARDQKNAAVRIYNAQGQVSFRQLNVDLSDGYSISLQDRAPGVYYVRVSTSEGYVVSPIVLK